MVTYALLLLFSYQQAMTAMLQQAMQYIDWSPDLETKIEVIRTLNSVAAGGEYVKSNSIAAHVHEQSVLVSWLL